MTLQFSTKRLLLILAGYLIIMVMPCMVFTSCSSGDDDDDNDTSQDDDDNDATTDDDDDTNTDDDDDNKCTELPQSCKDWQDAVCECDETKCNSIKNVFENWDKTCSELEQYCTVNMAGFTGCDTECSSDSDCDTGETCKNGKCVFEAECTLDSDCGENASCVNGQCKSDTIDEECSEVPAPFEYPENPSCKDYDNCLTSCPYIDEDDANLTEDQKAEQQQCISNCQANIAGDCMACIQSWQNCAQAAGCVRADNSIDPDCLFNNCMSEYFSCHSADLNTIEEASCKADERCVDVGGAGACFPADPNLVPTDPSTFPGGENERNGPCTETADGVPIEDDACYQSSTDMMCVKWYTDASASPMCTGFCPVTEIDVPRLVAGGCEDDETCQILGQDSQGNNMAFCVPNGWQPSQPVPGAENARNGSCEPLGMVDSCAANTTCVTFEGAADGKGICLQLCPETCTPSATSCPEENQLVLTAGDVCICAYDCTDDHDSCGEGEECCDVSGGAGETFACLNGGDCAVPASAADCIID